MEEKEAAIPGKNVEGKDFESCLVKKAAGADEACPHWQRKTDWRTSVSLLQHLVRKRVLKTSPKRGHSAHGRHRHGHWMPAAIA